MMAIRSNLLLKSNAEAFANAFQHEEAASRAERKGVNPLKVGIISKQAFSIINFRGPLIKELLSNGFAVYAFASDYDDSTRAGVEQLGAVPVGFSMSPTGMNPLRDIADLARLARLLRQYRLDISFSFFIKPVIYGTIAARMAGVPNRFAMIEGAGYVFDDMAKPSVGRQLLRLSTTLLYRIALKQAHRVFFLNAEDRALFVGHDMVAPEKVAMVNGIGVDLNHYAYTPPPAGPVSFILIARMLAEKGILEFVEAARKIRRAHPDARFILLGDIDAVGNRNCISRRKLEEWVSEGIIEWPGHVDDVRPWIASSSIFVLPSYYREGLPRSTQEAMSMGRAVITTDWIGCKETVREGFNGFKVPIRNTGALVAAMLAFIEQPKLVETMGTNSRLMAEQHFDARSINREILKIISSAVCEPRSIDKRTDIQYETIA